VQRARAQLVRLAVTAGHDDDVRVRHVGERRLRLQGEGPLRVADAAGLGRGEGDRRPGQVDEHLVGADGVEGGEAVKERDDDLHGCPLR
jgi:hypothetical protein